MSDRSERKPTTSEEMIRQAKQQLDDAVQDSAINEIVADLENIGTKYSPAERYPDSGSRPATRVDSGRPRRVASAYDEADDPFDRDTKSGAAKRPGVAIAAAILLILIGAFIAFFSASVGS